MFSRILGGVMLGLALCAFALEAGGTKDKDVVKDKKTIQDEKKGTVGVIKSVNMSEGTFTIATDKKKEVKFMVTDDTKFIGPKGGNRGMGKDGLKDDCMAKGYEVRVVGATKDAKAAAEVHLANRKNEKASDKK